MGPKNTWLGGMGGKESQSSAIPACTVLPEPFVTVTRASKAHSSMAPTGTCSIGPCWNAHQLSVFAPGALYQRSVEPSLVRVTPPLPTNPEGSSSIQGSLTTGSLSNSSRNGGASPFARGMRLGSGSPSTAYSKAAVTPAAHHVLTARPAFFGGRSNSY
ncbi:MAG: hypothetical protein ACUVYA_02595 [Planctomycetota bacterium]